MSQSYLQCMNHCGGCERTNCSHGNCIDQNRESAHCVRGCEARGEGQGCEKEFFVVVGKGMQEGVEQKVLAVWRQLDGEHCMRKLGELQSS